MANKSISREAILNLVKSAKEQKPSFFILLVSQGVHYVADEATIEKCKLCAKSRNESFAVREGIGLVPAKFVNDYILFLRLHGEVLVIDEKGQTVKQTKDSKVEVWTVKTDKPPKEEDVEFEVKKIVTMCKIDNGYLTKNDIAFLKDVFESYNDFSEKQPDVLIVFELEKGNIALINDDAHAAADIFETLGNSFDSVDFRSSIVIIDDISRIVILPEYKKEEFINSLSTPYVVWNAEDGLSDVIKNEKPEPPKLPSDQVSESERLKSLEAQFSQLLESVKILETKNQEAEAARAKAQAEAEENRKKLELREAKEFSPEQLKELIARSEERERQIKFWEKRIADGQETQEFIKTAKDLILEKPNASRVAMAIIVDNDKKTFSSDDMPEVLLDILDYAYPLALKRHEEQKLKFEDLKNQKIKI